MKTLLTVILFVLVGTYSSEAQVNKLNNNSKSKSRNQTEINLVNSVFNKIEAGLKSGEVNSFSDYFDKRTYLSLSGLNTGYYSTNQAYYLLDNYLNENRPVSFRFSNVSDSTLQPYATGVFNYNKKGVQSSKQVYISLKKFGDSWKISQLTIN